MTLVLFDLTLSTFNSKEQSIVKTFFNRTFTVVIAVLALITISEVLYLAKFRFVAMFALFSTGSAMAFWVREKMDEPAFRRAAFLYLFMGGVFLCMGIGELVRHSDLRSEENNYEIKIGEQSFRAFIVMASPDFIVVRDTQRQVRLIPRGAPNFQSWEVLANFQNFFDEIKLQVAKMKSSGEFVDQSKMNAEIDKWMPQN